MSVKVGIDARGRHYKMVNGKRVKAVEDQESHPRQPGALNGPIQRAMQRGLHGARDHGGVTHAVEQMLQTKFNELLSTTAKTSVGKAGQLFAARYLIAALNAGRYTEPTDKDTDELKHYVKDNGLDVPKFRDYLTHHGVHSDVTKAQDVVDEDPEILALVHSKGLNYQQLKEILDDAKVPTDSGQPAGDSGPSSD